MKISEKQILTLIKVAEAYIDTLKQFSTFYCDEARKRIELLIKQIHDQQSNELKEVNDKNMLILPHSAVTLIPRVK